jgi:REP element-mobilizing transposase RayT
MMRGMAVLAHGNRLRTGRYSEIGRGYLLTTVVKDRHALFADFGHARLAVAALRGCDDAGLSATLAFVLMPDHLHWLVQLRGGTLDGLMRCFKSRSAAAINRARATPGCTVWQAGFHDRAIRDGQDTRAMARYVIANPVRAGLVQGVGDYAHWDAVWVGGGGVRG